MNDRIKSHDKSATEYDHQVKKYRWFAHDLLFGLCYEYIKEGDRLLDVGIGTGLSSEHFAKAGVVVFGMDASKEMLRICESKNFTRELKQFDIKNKPWPYTASHFNLIIACAIFHFFKDLEILFGAVRRLIKRNVSWLKD